MIISLFSFVISFFINYLVLANAKILDSNAGSEVYMLYLNNLQKIILFISSMFPSIIKILIIIITIKIFIIDKYKDMKLRSGMIAVITLSMAYSLINYLNYRNGISDYIFVIISVLNWSSKVMVLYYMKNEREEKINEKIKSGIIHTSP